MDLSYPIGQWGGVIELLNALAVLGTLQPGPFRLLKTVDPLEGNKNSDDLERGKNS